MKRIENIKREELTSAIVKFIKVQEKNMGEKTNMKLDIKFSNWYGGMGRNKKWVYSEICLGDTSYTFKDKEITEEGFINLLEKCLKDSGVNGKVFSHAYGDGYWVAREYYFDRLEIFGKSCKEFKELNKILTKHGSKEIGCLDVYSVSICGKRSSYSDCGKYYYLCHDTKKCLQIIDYIKDNKGRNGVIKVEVKEFLNKGDEEDYRIAQYQESEWYGVRGNELSLTIKGGKNKKDYSKSFVI